MLFDDFVYPSNYELHRQAFEIQPSCHYISEQHLVTKRRAKHHFRRSILEAWDNLCAYCGKPADTLDHVRPRSKGGETKRSNLVCCCGHCNSRKGSDDFVQWFRLQPFWTADKEADIWLWLHQDFKAEEEA